MSGKGSISRMSDNVETVVPVWADGYSYLISQIFPERKTFNGSKKGESKSQ